ncbi:hypothetical protein RclHR1_16840002 [Rhizophagus clarus]|uniref:Uncharacterized protein n=1 Tax=Rhizophagus clarus TaxID=94130 RepID=A0A2Z6QZ51_9GLOM|nr:hypothetical protein RclHR1_16840002 [Rhizophagus clarus]
MLLLWFEFVDSISSIGIRTCKISLHCDKYHKKDIFICRFHVLALAHVFLILLQHTDFPDLDDITSKMTSYTLQNNAGDTTGTAQQIFDQIQDNPSKDFGTSFLSTYAWLRGSYSQEATWNSWAVEALSLVEKFTFISIKKIFRAIYTEASEKGRITLLQYRAALDEITFSSPRSESRYIYYLGKSESYDT